jgi:hypothetical protein
VPAFAHHLDEISKAELVAQIPAHAQDDDLSVEMAAFEKIINVQHPGPGSSQNNLPPNMRRPRASHQNQGNRRRGNREAGDCAKSHTPPATRVR